MTAPASAESTSDVTGYAVSDASPGVVFTRPWVAEMILDLAGYTADKDLCGQVAIEPACGTGVFVARMAARLAASAAAHGRDVRGATSAIRAYDVSAHAVRASRAAAAAALVEAGMTPREAASLARAWVKLGDFLLAPRRPTADYVIGNPPYVRLEDVPRDTMAAYRAAWPTMTGRSDLYVGFLEAGVRRLQKGGVLAFICADRWMRNQYGAGIRRLVGADFAVDATVVLHDVDAFENRVAAYPAVVVLRAGEQRQVLVADADPDFDELDARKLVDFARRAPHSARAASPARFRAAWQPRWFRGAASWPTGSPARLEVLEHLEARFPPLDAPAGTRIGIGVATGADNVYITDSATVEADRLIAIVTPADISDGTLKWGGRLLVNPWADESSVVDLSEYPRLRAHLAPHQQRLRARHVGRRDPARWWRTIDVVRPAVAEAPKLLMPDLKAHIHPVLDPGGHYPSHNLYYITSAEWDLAALGGLLLSDVARMFVEAYSVRMANGCLRVTAQYLRRIRVPMPDSMDDTSLQALADAFRNRDRAAATDAALRVYGLRSVPTR